MTIALANVPAAALLGGESVLGVQAGKARLLPLPAPTVITPPAGFPWDFVQYPFSVSQAGGLVCAQLNPRGFIPSAVWQAPVASQVFHVDAAAGSDAATGLGAAAGDFSAALQSICRAVTVGNATGKPYRLLVKAGVYPRSLMLNGAMTTIMPTQDFALEAWGGRVVMGPFDQIAYAQDATYANTWSAALSNAVRVFDLAAPRDPWGDYPELVAVADAATCNATPGSWVLTGGRLYVRRADGAAVTFANTRVHRQSNGANLDATTRNAFFEGVDFEGGVGGALDCRIAATRNVVAVNCSFKYAGGAAYAVNGFSADKQTGLCVLMGCTANANAADGFNFHATDNAFGRYALLVNCRGYDNGRYASPSDNGFTGHETTVSVDVNGDYRHNHGGTVRFIGNSRVWCAGTFAQGDQGDVVLGGTLGPTEFCANDACIMWLDWTRAASSGVAVTASGPGATVFKRNHATLSGTELAGAGGAITVLPG